MKKLVISVAMFAAMALGVGCADDDLGVLSGHDVVGRMGLLLPRGNSALWLTLGGVLARAFILIGRIGVSRTTTERNHRCGHE